MADMHTELDRALAKPPVVPPSWVDELGGWFADYIRGREAQAWEAGRCAATRGVRTNPYLEERL